MLLLACYAVFAARITGIVWDWHPSFSSHLGICFPLLKLNRTVCSHFKKTFFILEKRGKRRLFLSFQIAFEGGQA